MHSFLENNSANLLVSTMGDAPKVATDAGALVGLGAILVTEGCTSETEHCGLWPVSYTALASGACCSVQPVVGDDRHTAGESTMLLQLCDVFRLTLHLQTGCTANARPVTGGATGGLGMSGPCCLDGRVGQDQLVLSHNVVTVMLGQFQPHQFCLSCLFYNTHGNAFKTPLPSKGDALELCSPNMCDKTHVLALVSSNSVDVISDDAMCSKYGLPLQVCRGGLV
uniref:Uncharacterized protein n=1 Tax=viral metagenome TaxID=1070528 RepID=A0A2V0RBN6_9ZZZZ